MILYASSCERPSKSSARVFLPSSVSNSYSFSTRTQGRSRRVLVISSFRFACSASSFASSSRATCHSSRVPILCSSISSPSSPIQALPHEPNPSSQRTLPGSPIETPDDPETHRNCPRSQVATMSFTDGGPQRNVLAIHLEVSPLWSRLWRPEAHGRLVRNADRPPRTPGSARACGHAARTHLHSSCRSPHRPQPTAW